MNGRLRRVIATVATTVATTAALVSCGSYQYSGAQVEPLPEVGQVVLPDLSHGGELTPMQASAGHLMAVYFGYTSCPDLCPTTMSDLGAALNRLDDPSLIEPAMVTVDPDRDLATLAAYVDAFFPTGRAFGTSDRRQLSDAAEAFGVTYSVDPNPDAATDPSAEPVVVSHSSALYLVNAKGQIVLTWTFGTTVDDLTADLQHALADRSLMGTP